MNRSTASTVAGLLGERDRGLQDLGFTWNGDANAPSVAFDPTNVFSRAALLQRTYRQAQAGNANSYAARGQFNSGAYQRQVANTNFNQQADETRLSRTALDFVGRSLAAVRAAQLGAQDRIDTELAPAAIDRVASNYVPPAFGKPVGQTPSYFSSPATASPQTVNTGRGKVRVMTPEQIRRRRNARGRR